MTAADRYFDALTDVLDGIRRTQSDAIEQAAAIVADAVGAGGRVWVAPTSHVLHTELVMRAGGLAAVHALGEPPDLSNPMLDASAGALTGDGVFDPARGDVVLVGTNAGTDAGTVEVALRAREAGCVVVALTSVAYETWPDVVRQHGTRARLVDVADLVVDIGGVVGDGVVELPRLDTALAPTSGAALVATSWAMLARAAELLVERGREPIVYRSVQIPGAEALFRERKAAYERTGSGAPPTPGRPADDGAPNSASTSTGAPRRSDS